MPETETTEITFLHHHQERTIDEAGEKVATDYVPGQTASLPARTADALVRNKIAAAGRGNPVPSTSQRRGTPPAAPVVDTLDDPSAG